MNKIQLYNQVSVFNEESQETIVAGQYFPGVTKIVVTSESCKEYRIVFCSYRTDFYIIFNKKINSLQKLTFSFEFDSKAYIEEFVNVALTFPFDEIDLNLSRRHSAVISTICKDYSFRLKEWIEYNLKLGFSGIVVFDNDFNEQNPINEKRKINRKWLHPPLIPTKEVCLEYKHKVHVINFPYKPFNVHADNPNYFNSGHWNVIQRITLCLGVIGLRTKCKHIALIDPDEFLYMPKSPLQSIETFLSELNSIRIQHCYITNQGYEDFVNNNALKLATFTNPLTEKDDVTNPDTIEGCKVILSSNVIEPEEFILTPHTHKSCHTQIAKVSDIVCYHCWLNGRTQYTPDMRKFDGLNDVLRSKSIN